MNGIFRCKRETEEKKPTRYFSDKQEKQAAKVIGGRQTKNSGATMFQKGDVLQDKLLLECKTCEKPQKSFSIKKAWIEKNLYESAQMGKEFSAIAFNFGPDEPNYFVIDEFLMKVLIERLNEGID